ncbi:hypothetical protein CPB86DRAFT_818941 [Serendipita vermifera]|nr:hypothetical protein CPB86DRAFT_818941 [Serendipita vermifera]
MLEFQGRIPGGVLQTVLEEQHAMNQFLKIWKRRMKLDAKYLQELERIHTSIKQGWKSLNVYPLIVPMIDYFEAEILEHHRALESMQNWIKEQKYEDILDRNLESGKSMIEAYIDLEHANRNLKEQKEIASSVDAVRDLHAWQDQMALGPQNQSDSFIHVPFTSNYLMANFVLPKEERRYRRCIYTQNQLALSIAPWHKHDLPDLLDEHQRHSEGIKKLVQHLGNEYSNLSMCLIQHLSKAKDDLANFSSHESIAKCHENVTEEAGHEYMIPATYVNFATGKAGNAIVYGLSVDQVQLSTATIPPEPAVRPSGGGMGVLFTWDITAFFLGIGNALVEEGAAVGRRWGEFWTKRWRENGPTW